MSGYQHHTTSAARLTAAVPGPLAVAICSKLSWHDVAASLALYPEPLRDRAREGWEDLRAAQAVFLDAVRRELPVLERVPEPDATLLSTAEAAAIAQTSPRTVRRWYTDGKVAGAVVRGSIMVDAGSLGDHLRSRPGDSGQARAA